MLAEEARTSNRRLTARQIANKFTTPIGETQVKIALSHLEKVGLASGNFDNVNSMGFQITRDGLLSVEGGFDRVDNGHNSTYIPSAEPTVWDQDQPDALAEQGTYVFSIPPEPSTSSPETGPAPVIIYNNVNPTFSNANTQENLAVPSVGGNSKIDWTKWGTVLGALGIVVTILIAVIQ